MLSKQEKERYSRHLSLLEIGEEGQEKIGQTRILVVGAGGLGSPVLYYLAAAGVGTIGIMDDDKVSESNLQRQILYDSSCIGEAKVSAAKRKLEALNPQCRIFGYEQRLEERNACLVNDYDIIIDATDNLLSRYIINDACVKYGKPFVYGSICEFEGQVSVFNHKGGPTYRDLFEYHEDIASFRQPLGVIGALPGVVGSLQAAEAIKIILDCCTLSGKLLLINILYSTFSTIDFNTK